jgi:biofilm PGA synthesis N-glycosyltransferase PgaC
MVLSDAETMSFLEVTAQIAFWLSGAILVYTYLGFPLCLLLLPRRHKLRADLSRDEELPTVSFVVSLYNEELVVEEKIGNCFKLDYPPDKLRFYFVSESTDGTNEILRRNAGERLHAEIRTGREGKFNALCSLIPKCQGEILVLSDANTYYFPDSIRKLARHFQDPDLGVATGDVRLLPSEEKFGAGEGFYYRYERRLQVLESEFWSTVGVDGGMYAMRREHFPEKPPSFGVNDDLYVAMSVALKGLRIVYDPEAIAEESPTPQDKIEFGRKTRIVAFGLRAFMKGQGVPGFSQARLLWVFLSHKVVRWLAPVFLLAALFSSLGCALLIRSYWRWLFGIQVLFYCLAVMGWRFETLNSLLFRIPYYFSMVNLAALLGLIRGFKKEPSIWMRTARFKAP